MKIALFGYYGFGNIGDDLMLQSIVTQMLANARLTRLFVMCRDPRRVPAFEDPRVCVVGAEPGVAGLLSKLRVWMAADCFVWGGGTCLYEPKAGETGGLQGLLRNVILFRCLGKPCYFVGVGIGYLGSKKARFLVKGILSLASRFYFRDQDSIRDAKSLVRAGPTRFLEGGDFVFCAGQSLAPKINSASDASIAEKGTAQRPFVVFVGVSSYANDPVVVDAWAENLRRISKYLDVDILFVAFHHGEHSDHQFHYALAGKLAGVNCRFLESDTMNDITAVLAHARLVIAMRLHAVVVADLLGVPNLAVSYSPKVARYVQRSGWAGGGRLVALDGVVQTTQLDLLMQRFPDEHKGFVSFAKRESELARASIDAVLSC